MSRKSRRSRARLAQEQSLVAKLKKELKDTEKQRDSVAMSLVAANDQLAAANVTIEKQSRPDMIACIKSNWNGPRGDMLAFQVQIDARHAKMAFFEARSYRGRGMDSLLNVSAYAQQVAHQLYDVIAKGIEDSILDRKTKESILS